MDAQEHEGEPTVDDLQKRIDSLWQVIHEMQNVMAILAHQQDRQLARIFTLESIADWPA